MSVCSNEEKPSAREKQTSIDNDRVIATTFVNQKKFKLRPSTFVGVLTNNEEAFEYSSSE